MTERRDNPLAAELSAFLDDELDEASRVRVEQWLATDITARQTLADLQAVARGLQALPRHKAPARLSASVQRRTVDEDNRIRQRGGARLVSALGAVLASAALITLLILPDFLRPARLQGTALYGLDSASGRGSGVRSDEDVSASSGGASGVESGLSAALADGYAPTASPPEIDSDGTSSGKDLEVIVTPQTAEQYAATTKLLSDWGGQAATSQPADELRLRSLGYPSSLDVAGEADATVMVSDAVAALQALEQAAPGQVLLTMTLPPASASADELIFAKAADKGGVAQRSAEAAGGAGERAGAGSARGEAPVRAKQRQPATRDVAGKPAKRPSQLPSAARAPATSEPADSRQLTPAEARRKRAEAARLGRELMLGESAAPPPQAAPAPAGPARLRVRLAPAPTSKLPLNQPAPTSATSQAAPQSQTQSAPASRPGAD